MDPENYKYKYKGKIGDVIANWLHVTPAKTIEKKKKKYKYLIQKFTNTNTKTKLGT